MESKELRWERVDHALCRAGVPGGWLYRYSFPTGWSIAFVPAPAPTTGRSSSEHLTTGSYSEHRLWPETEFGCSR